MVQNFFQEMADSVRNKFMSFIVWMKVILGNVAVFYSSRQKLRIDAALHTHTRQAVFLMHIGKETLAKNRDRLRSYTYSPDMDSDCFIHLLMTGSFIFTSTCSFTI